MEGVREVAVVAVALLEHCIRGALEGEQGAALLWPLGAGKASAGRQKSLRGSLVVGLVARLQRETLRILPPGTARRSR